MKKQGKTEERIGFGRQVRELIKNPHVRRMKSFTQHGRVSTFDHCQSVAKLSYRINRWLHLHADEKRLVHGAMLHDFYLYDWHAYDGGTHRLHGFHHADVAADNASRLLHVEPGVEKIIRTHMWPLTITKVPKSREAWIVCVADKVCSLNETLFCR